ncbi:ribonuclease HII [Candidatus Peribacteria bacterium RIFCSPHIGHO2_01_FULL_55_13]|nr:MAG: ribonuclease HII [Candidatus Peribacteria bacterium RIFCSPHIGHO2_01_FULL_55_13]
MEPKSVTAGIDEAGRGPLAGPVVAAACILPTLKRFPRFICDSKALDEDAREEAYGWITKHCIIGVGLSGSRYVDERGILAATERAMQQAVAMLAHTVKPTHLLVDGRDKFWFDYPHTSIIDGDALEKCISAASIVAKVSRDHMMRQMDLQFPGYGFAQHKGYGTEMHYAMIRKLGMCGIHRRSYL